MKRLLALDFGLKRIGVAVSDGLGMLAHPVETIDATQLDKVVECVGDLLREYETDAIIVGLPLNMDGSESAMSQRVRKFAATLHERLGVICTFWDERLSSAQAEWLMAEMEYTKKRCKKLVDQIAARTILQSYLEYLRIQARKQAAADSGAVDPDAPGAQSASSSDAADML